MVVALLTGFAAGTAVRASAGRLRQRRETLTADDREHLSEHFRIHTEAVTSQVSEFADNLAAGDPLLRERLRQLEPRIRA